MVWICNKAINVVHLGISAGTETLETCDTVDLHCHFWLFHDARNTRSTLIEFQFPENLTLNFCWEGATLDSSFTDLSGRLAGTTVALAVLTMFASFIHPTSKLQHHKSSSFIPLKSSLHAYD